MTVLHSAPATASFMNIQVTLGGQDQHILNIINISPLSDFMDMMNFKYGPLAHGISFSGLSCFTNAHSSSIWSYKLL
ncbi:MAG: hypothetical protein ACFWUJ_10695 [Pseudomonas fragi]